MKRHFALLLLIILAACTPRYAPTPNPASRVSHDRAVEIALQLASQSRPEISGAVGAPTNVSARLVKLDAALKELSISGSIPQGYDVSTSVWLVTMDGLWNDEASAPGATTVPNPYHHCAFILNIDSGAEIESSCRP